MATVEVVALQLSTVENSSELPLLMFIRVTVLVKNNLEPVQQREVLVKGLVIHLSAY